MKSGHRSKDLIVTVILVLLAGWIWYYSERFPDMPEGYPGPKLFPRIIAVGLGLIGLGIGLKLLLGASGPEAGPQETSEGKSPLRLILGILLLALFPVFSPFLGFVNSLLVVGVLMGFTLQVKWWKTLLTVGVTVAGVYLIFAKLLSVPL